MKNYHHAEVTTTDQKLDRIIELLEKLQPEETNWQRKNLRIDGKWYTFNWNSNEPSQCYYEVLVNTTELPSGELFG